ncbi:hypothetical protein MRX96_003181 [Rhipicephalus microplus]
MRGNDNDDEVNCGIDSTSIRQQLSLSHDPCLEQRPRGVGILQTAKSGNAPHSSETNAPLKLKAREGNTAAVPLAVVLGANRLSYELEVLNLWLAVPDDLELAPLAYLARYIARACEEKLPCESCKVLLQETKPCGSIYDLVKKIDNGELRNVLRL